MADSSTPPQSQSYAPGRVTGPDLALEQALDVVSDIFVLLDAEFRLTYHNEANRAAMRAGGGDPAEAIGKVVWDVLPMPPGTDAERECRRAMRDRVVTQWEERYHPDVCLRGRAYPLLDGGLLVVATNVTEAWQAADVARVAMERTASLQHVTSALSRAATPRDVARVIIEQGCVALGASGGFASTLDSTGETLAIVDALNYGDQLVRDYFRASIEAPYPACEVARTGHPIWLETRAERVTRYPVLVDTEVTRRFGSWMFLPLSGPHGTLGVLSFAFDAPGAFDDAARAFAISLAEQCAQALERAQLHDAERAARAAAEEANRVKVDFLRAMSHELRTPLNAIGGYADLLALGVRGELSDEQREDVERIRRNQRHLLGIINDILNYARIDAGHLTYELGDVPVRGILDATEPLIAPQLRDKRIAFTVEPCAAEMVVRADSEKVRQVLLNLLANAVKFTPAGGRVTVACTWEGDHVYVRVRDTGVGIPRERIAEIFEPFVQVHRSLAAPTTGTGLGLAISRELARGMGGDLSVESTPGAGSVFTLTLPRA